MVTVWLVWEGTWEPTLISIHTSEASARQVAHKLSKQYRSLGPDFVTVEEREVIE